jgi:acetyl-CoA carboxylase biotin carboxylase subunit
LFKKILIANRGEIAVRIIRACKELNIRTVAIHSNVDTEAMHVKLADESVCVGGALPNESYLNIPSIISAIEITGADAVHPGYGFLSESDKFSKILSSHKVKFIGPSSKSILELGNKSNALKLANEFKLPILGNKNSKNLGNTNDALKIANEIGMPIVIKAAYGGGGKGMRVFNNNSEINNYSETEN